MELFDLIERTLDYRWLLGAHRRYFDVHTWPRGNAWRLRSHLTMVCPHEGSYSVCLRDSDDVYTVHKNEVVFIPGLIALRVHQPTAGTQSYAHVQYSMLGSLDPILLFDLPNTYHGRKAKKVREALLDFTECHCRQERDLELIARRKETAFKLFRVLIENGKLNREKADHLYRFPRIEPVISYVQSHLDSPITREKMAKIAGLSMSRFNTVFTEIMGIAPKQYVQEQRLKKAVDLLRDPDMSMSEIAEQTGFCDQFEFSRRFKKRWGSSPLAYRKALKSHEEFFG